MNALATAAFLLAAIACLAPAATAQTQEWQVRSICDLRKGGGAAGRMAECAQLAAEVVMLLPEKAGPGNVAVVADLTDNLEKSGVKWDAPCKDPAHCPEAAYTIRYAFISTKIVSIPKDKLYTALICREGFSDTAQDDASCRLKLLKVVREMAIRARNEGALLAIIRCGGGEADAIRPDGQGVAGFELVYAFVKLPDMLPMAKGGDPKAAAGFALGQIAGPEGAQAPAGKGPAAGPARERAPQGQARMQQAQAGAGQNQARAGQSDPGANQGQARPESSVGQQPSAARVAPAQASVTAQPTAAEPAKASPYSLPAVNAGEVVMQVAALPSVVQAEAVSDRLSAHGIVSSFERAEVGGREYYRVLARAAGNPDAFRQRLAELGYPGAIQRR